MDPHAHNDSSLPPAGAHASLGAALQEANMDPHARKNRSLPPTGAHASLGAALQEA